MDTLKLQPDPRLGPAPERTAFDYGLAIAKAGSLAFPFFGAGVTLFDLVSAPLRGKRLSDWCEELRLRLNELSQKVAGLTPERQAKDEAFISAFGHATQAALRTHQLEKREALRNAVLNISLGNAPSDDQQSIFLNLIDRFTPLHLQILRFLNGSSPKPNLQNDLCNQVVLDLNNSGLLQDGRPFAARGRDYPDLLSAGGWKVNSVGTQFLDFIREPEKDKS